MNSQESKIESGKEYDVVYFVSVGNVTIYVTSHGVEVVVDLPSTSELILASLERQSKKCHINWRSDLAPQGDRNVIRTST